MSNKIQIKRGLKANLPILSVGEPAFTTDTKEFFIGDGSSNIEFAKQSDLTYETATGTTGTAIILTLPTLVNGYAKTFIALASNSGSATTINGKSLYKPNTTMSPNLIAGKAYTIWYDLAKDCFFIKASAEGNTIPSHVLAGDIFSTETDIGATGTMPTKVATTYTPSKLNQTISALQYLLGAQTILGDADLDSSNIKSGVNIFGVVGSSTVVDTSDASLDPQYLLVGQTGYDDGIKKTGTLVNRTGIIMADSVGKWGDGGLAVYQPRGYYKGGAGDGEIKVTQAQIQSVNGNLQPANILNGVEICGIIGNASIKSLGGRQIATATVTSSSNSIIISNCFGDNTYHYIATITGFNFTPSYAILYSANGNTVTVLNMSTDRNYQACAFVNASNSAGSHNRVDSFDIDGSVLVASYGQLKLPVKNNTTYSYIIFE